MYIWARTISRPLHCYRLVALQSLDWIRTKASHGLPVPPPPFTSPSDHSHSVTRTILLELRCDDVTTLFKSFDGFQSHKPKPLQWPTGPHSLVSHHLYDIFSYDLPVNTPGMLEIFPLLVPLSGPLFPKIFLPSRSSNLYSNTTF